MSNITQIKEFLILVFFFLLVYSCEFKVERTYEFERPVLGPIKIDSNFKFKNLFLVTEDKCELWNKPNTRFVLSYPENIIVDTLKEGDDKKYYYINFKSVRGDTILEELTIGSLTSIRELDVFMGKKLAQERINQLSNNKSDFEVLYSKVDSFYKQNNFKLITEVELEDSKDGYFGKYYNLETSYYPKINNKNPVRVVWTKNNSLCKPGKLVFDNETLMGKIWNTFTFIE